jgi:hypothetical protein
MIPAFLHNHTQTIRIRGTEECELQLDWAEKQSGLFVEQQMLFLVK